MFHVEKLKIILAQIFGEMFKVTHLQSLMSFLAILALLPPKFEPHQLQVELVD